MDVEETLILPELQGTSTIIKDYHLHLVRERERERERERNHAELSLTSGGRERDTKIIQDYHIQ